MNITHHVERGAAEYPTRVALRHNGVGVTYREIDGIASMLAGHLDTLGIREGDRIGIAMTNRPEFAFIYLATLKIGAIAVTLNPSWRTTELAYALNDSGAGVLAGDDSCLRELAGTHMPGLRHVFSPSDLTTLPGAVSRRPATEVDPDTPAVIVYTSGTTGTPKGVVLSHANVISNIDAKVQFLELTPHDRLLLFVPLSHCFGQNAILNAGFQAGATILLEDGFNPSRIAQLLETEQPTRFFGPPTVFSALLDAFTPDMLSAVRYFFSAAAPLSPATALRFEDTFGVPIHQGYGLTETSPFVTYNHRSGIRLGSVGTPITGVSVQIIDPDTHKVCAPDQIGEVTVRGPNVMLGYWNRPEVTAERLQDGWLFTGDAGRLDTDGYLYLVDRLDDVINVAGHNVYPAEVEAVLARCPPVAAAAAYAVDDKVFGQRVAATVTLRTGHHTNPEELLDACRTELAHYQVPVHITVAAALPMSATGKILRHQLRATAYRRPSHDGH